MNDLLNSEQFADWIGIAIFGAICWLLSIPARRQALRQTVPWWLALLTAARPGDPVYLPRLTGQLYAILLVGWETLLVLFISDHVSRVRLLIIGFVTLTTLILPFQWLVQALWGRGRN